MKRIKIDNKIENEKSLDSFARWVTFHLFYYKIETGILIIKSI
jgi:hypothetical protein